MAYTGNPSTNTSDALRLYVWDLSTSTSAELLSDNEVTFFLGANPSVLWAAASAADALAGKYSGGTLTEKQVGDLKEKIGGGDPAATYRSRADQLRMEAALSVRAYSGGISIDDKQKAEDDTDWDSVDVKLRMHDNRRGVSTSTGDF
jgi:hypothetical protein